jgi:hypothetical protein
MLIIFGTFFLCKNPFINYLIGYGYADFQGFLIKSAYFLFLPGDQEMNRGFKDTGAGGKKSKTGKKGWWSRFLERLAKANSESAAVVCRH